MLHAGLTNCECALIVTTGSAGNGGGLPDEDPGTPILPDRTEPCPEESIRGRELRPLHRALQNTDLMTKRDDLELKRCPTLE
jgi:hypothetical protein